MSDNWEEVRRWRRAKRIEILIRRSDLPKPEKDRISADISDIVREEFPELRHARVGFFWPFKGEIDLRYLVKDFISLGARAALPVVVEKGSAMEFWEWRPGAELQHGVWNIPHPAKRKPLRPTALLVSLVGFDGAGYRLGYGGGYYDRTLARMNPRPLTIGVGYDFGRLETIHPQPHDIPLDAIVTETRVARLRYRGVPTTDADRVGGHGLRNVG